MRLLDPGSQGMSGREKKRRANSIPKDVLAGLIGLVILAESDEGIQYLGNPVGRFMPSSASRNELVRVQIRMQKVKGKWVTVENRTETLEFMRVAK